ncbi:BnaC03g67510D [Brassica napus]|uniref:BnaC03g67510D protein n=1 Tax=Brassica napus TaxID=3708 RepID=A0A078HQE4_BRANA|nr:BnaC03g67510D [Brassica napus]
MFFAVVIIFSSNFCLNTQCTATVDAVFHGSPWYYIGCGVCHTKAIKGPTSLMCQKCGKHEVDGVPQYLTKLSVYDNNDQAVFVILGEAGHELTGKQASEFIVKVSDRNLKGQIHTLTVTKVLPLDAPEPVEALVETVSEETVDGRVKRGSDLVESGEAKRAKSGN